MFEIKFFLRGCLRRALMALCAAAYLAGFMVCGSGLLITEVQWSNPSLKFPDIPGTPDWVEVYNSGEEALNLSGYGLSDDVNRPFRWRFPSRLLPPGGLVLVYLAGDDVSGPADVAPSSPDGISGMDFWFDAGIDDSLTLTGSLVREWRSNGGAFGDEARLLSPDPQSDSSPVRMDDSHGIPVKALQFDGVNDRMFLGGVDARIDNWTETVYSGPPFITRLRKHPIRGLEVSRGRDICCGLIMVAKWEPVPDCQSAATELPFTNTEVHICPPVFRMIATGVQDGRWSPLSIGTARPLFLSMESCGPGGVQR